MFRNFIYAHSHNYDFILLGSYSQILYIDGKKIWQIMTVGSLTDKNWRIEVHLQFDLMSHVFICQFMDTHSHTWNGACLIKWKPKPYSTGHHQFCMR